MKILVISTYPPERNGIAPYTYEIVQRIKRKTNLNFVIVADKIPGLSGIEKRKNEKILRIFDKNDFFYYKKIIELVKRESPDIVQIQHSFGLFGKHFGIPIIPLLLHLKLHKIPTFTTIHTVWIFEEMKKLNEIFPKILIAKLAFYLMTKLIEKLSTKIIVLSNVTKKRLIKDYGVESKKIEIVHYGVEKKKIVSKNQAKKRLGLDGKFVLFCFGLPYKTKGFEYALMALNKIIKKIPNVVLLISSVQVKDEKTKKFVSLSYIQKLKELIDKLKLKDRVILTDFIKTKDQQKYFSASDLVVLPYLSLSGISSSLYTALEYGSPCLVTNIDCFKEIKNGKTGLVVPSADPDAISKAVIKFKADEKFRQKIIRNVRKLISSEWTWDNISNLNFKIYEKNKL